MYGCIVGLTLWLLVAVVKDYVRGVVDACGEILHFAFAKLVHSEDNVVDIGDAIYVVLKYVYAEWMQQIWTTSKRTQLRKTSVNSIFCAGTTQLFFKPETEMTGSEPSRRTLPITESLASAQ